MLVYCQHRRKLGIIERFNLTLDRNKIFEKFQVLIVYILFHTIKRIVIIIIYLLRGGYWWKEN